MISELINDGGVCKIALAMTGSVQKLAYIAANPYCIQKLPKNAIMSCMTIHMITNFQIIVSCLSRSYRIPNHYPLNHGAIQSFDRVAADMMEN